MYRLCASFAEQAQCVMSLATRAESLRQKLAYSDQDSRAVVLNNIRSIANSTQMILNLLDSWTIGDDTVRTNIPLILGMRDLNENSVRSAGDILHKTSKLSLSLLAQFQIENGLRSLSRELGSVSQPTGFFLAAKALLERIAIPIDRLEILNTPALIRNSLHSNGIHHGHRGTDSVTVLGGVTYEFRHMNRVQCATVEHIAHALECSLDVFEEIVSTPQVAGLADPIMDQFVWEIATLPSENT